MKYQFIIAIDDKEDNPLPSKKVGDIISIMPYNAPLGRGTLDEYLVLIIDTIATKDIVLCMCQECVYFDLGMNLKVTRSDYEYATLGVEHGGKGLSVDRFQYLYKRRFAIPIATSSLAKFIVNTNVRSSGLAKLHTSKANYISKYANSINMEKIEDVRCMYQPFLKKSTILQSFNNSHPTTYDENEKFYELPDGELISMTDLNHPLKCLYIATKFNFELETHVAKAIQYCKNMRKQNDLEFDEISYFCSNISVQNIIDNWIINGYLIEKDIFKNLLCTNTNAITEENEFILNIDEKRIIWDKVKETFIIPNDLIQELEIQNNRFFQAD